MSNTPEIQEINEAVSQPQVRRPYRVNVFRSLEQFRPSSFKSEKSPTCIVQSPIHYEKGYAYPLIVWLHGSGRDEQQLLHIMPSLSVQNYVAVAPRGLTRLEAGISKRFSESKQVCSLYNWFESPDAIFKTEERIFEAVHRATSQYNIAKNRIFIAGLDVGGTMALRIGTRFPNVFAGAISLGGSFPATETPLRNWRNIRSFPILITVGSRGVSYSARSAAQQLKQFHTAGLSVSIRQYNAGQELTPQMLFDVNRWIMQQVESLKKCSR